MAQNKPIRVIIVDDQPIIRSGLAAFLMAYPELQLVGEANDGEEAIELCELIQPDVVLMDVKMPRMDGISAARQIHARWPSIRILILTSFKDDDTVDRAMSAGATGFILKDVGADDLALAIFKVFTGERTVAAESPQSTIAPGPLTVDSPRTHQELISAGKIQASILPDEPPRLPGWELSASLRSARETSGDFYDFIPLANGNLGIVIADVTDKGIGAALFMALSNTLVRTYAAQYPALPAFALGQVNRRILTDTRGTMFVTLFYGVLEPDTGRLRYVNAGHNPPLLVSSQKGKPIDRLQGTGMALGVMEDATWQQKVTKFIPGDTLVLYTDGVTEAQDRVGNFFGERRLQDVVKNQRSCSAYEVQEAIFDEVQRFSRQAPLYDDMTLVVVRRK